MSVCVSVIMYVCVAEKAPLSLCVCIFGSRVTLCASFLASLCDSVSLSLCVIACICACLGV